MAPARRFNPMRTAGCKSLCRTRHPEAVRGRAGTRLLVHRLADVSRGGLSFDRRARFDYPTDDGAACRDYLRVSYTAEAHVDAL